MKETEAEFLLHVVDELDFAPCIAFDRRALGGGIEANWMCNRPETIHACRPMKTCRLCWLRCEAQARASRLLRVRTVAR